MTIVYLQKLLQENYLKMSDFDEMVITIGPGSYTGVRVALTIAKTLNATMNIKVKTVSSKGDGRNEKSYFYFRCKKP